MLKEKKKKKKKKRSRIKKKKKKKMKKKKKKKKKRSRIKKKKKKKMKMKKMKMKKKKMMMMMMKMPESGTSQFDLIVYLRYRINLDHETHEHQSTGLQTSPCVWPSLAQHILMPKNHREVPTLRPCSCHFVSSRP